MDIITKLFTLFALMIAALSFTACGGGDDEEGDNDEDIVFSILIDGHGKSNTINYTRSWAHEYYDNYENANYEKGKNRFVILPMLEVYEIDIAFPSHHYEASDFQKGTQLLSADNVEITHWADPALYWYPRSVRGNVISGSANILKNDGNRITIQFNKYKYRIEDPNDHVIEVTLNGELNFKITD